MLWLGSLLASFVFHPLHGVSVGNPADPSLLEEGFWISDQSLSSLRFGVSDDVLFLKHLKPAPLSQDLRISHSQINWNLIIFDVGWNLRERFDLHLLAGPISKMNARWQQERHASLLINHHGIFLAGTANLTLLEIEDTTIGLSAQGGGILDIKGTYSVNGFPSKKGSSSRLLFWQVAAGISQNVGPLRPYVGFVANHSSYKIENPSLHFLDQLGIGCYEGCSLSLGSRIYLNLEVRQFFESGLSLSGELRF